MSVHSPPTPSTRLGREAGHRMPIYGPPAGDAPIGVISIAYRDLHPHDLAQLLDQWASASAPATTAPSR